MDSIQRKTTRKIKVGDKFIGGDAPVTVQSMTNTDTRDAESTIAQIIKLQDAGCDLVRVAVPDMEACESIKAIKKSISIPLIADIHFDYKLAIQSIRNGADKIRINPGNIGGRENIEKIVKEAAEKNAAIRIGVNSGSIEKEILQKYKGATPEGMAESAFRHLEMLNEMNFSNIVLSMKASNVLMTIQAYRIMSEKTDFPLHVGVTEAGTLKAGTIKSSVAIGCLLAEGIGDTIRVSLTADPVEEVIVGNQILKSLGLKNQGIEFISCPTCGRCKIDLFEIVNEVEKRLSNIKSNLTVAIMGCAVNGPGEASNADIGIAGGNKEVLLFKKGEIVGKIEEKYAVDVLVEEVKKMTE